MNGSVAKRVLGDFVPGSIFTPLMVKGTGGKRVTLVVPGSVGGVSRPGASTDPETRYLCVESQTRPVGMALVEPDPACTDWRYVIKHANSAGRGETREVPAFAVPCDAQGATFGSW